jgi:hypothetical protein
MKGIFKGFVVVCEKKLEFSLKCKDFMWFIWRKGVFVRKVLHNRSFEDFFGVF